MTNSQENEVLVKASFYTVKTVVNRETGKATYLPDKLLGEIRFIHPGTNVKSVMLKSIPSGTETAVMVKISTIFEDPDGAMVFSTFSCQYPKDRL